MCVITTVRYLSIQSLYIVMYQYMQDNKTCCEALICTRIRINNNNNNNNNNNISNNNIYKPMRYRTNSMSIGNKTNQN